MNTLKQVSVRGYRQWLAPHAGAQPWALNPPLKLPGYVSRLPAAALLVNRGGKPDASREEIPFNPVEPGQLVTALKWAFQEDTRR